MAELGEAAPRYHEAIGDLAADLGLEVIGVGESARAYRPAVWTTAAEAALEAARTFVRPGDAILVKASRAVGLEGIADEIANFARAWSQS
jgi:UDP-N-acetylmuramoyl-tripeptide--D-alanyl-D-alanine ligase